jgi:hypothetical protein
MPGFKRATRECSVSELNPRLLEAFEEYFSKHKYGDLTEAMLMCCETFSEKEKAGILDTLLTGNPGSTGFLGLILTDRRLLWARTGDRSKPTVFGADLNYIQVKAYSSRITKETELQISGYIGDSKEHIQGNLAMGPEEAARKFCEETLKAVEKINPPAKKKSLFG